MSCRKHNTDIFYICNDAGISDEARAIVTTSQRHKWPDYRVTHYHCYVCGAKCSFGKTNTLAFLSSRASSGLYFLKMDCKELQEYGPRH